jgi:hypothetical protein
VAGLSSAATRDTSTPVRRLKLPRMQGKLLHLKYLKQWSEDQAFLNGTLHIMGISLSTCWPGLPVPSRSFKQWLQGNSVKAMVSVAIIPSKIEQRKAEWHAAIGLTS